MASGDGAAVGDGLGAHTVFDGRRNSLNVLIGLSWAEGTRCPINNFYQVRLGLVG